MAEPSPTVANPKAESVGPEPSGPAAESVGPEAAVSAAERSVRPEAAAPADPVESAERIAFLSLAAELAKGLNVLVIEDGAGSLAGIAAHLDSVTLEELSAKQGAGYQMLIADLPADGGIAAQTVAEIASALDPGNGFALVRVPNTAANAALRDHLQGAFSNSLGLRQANWIASAVLTDELFGSGDPAQASATTLRKNADAAVGEELYTIVLAAHGELPKLRPHIAITRSRELRELTDELERVRAAASAAAQQATASAAAQDAVIRELQEEVAWLDEHELNLRVKIVKRPWALTLVNAWARFVGLARRAKGKLRW